MRQCLIEVLAAPGPAHDPGMKVDDHHSSAFCSLAVKHVKGVLDTIGVFTDEAASGLVSEVVVQVQIDAQGK